MILALLSSMWRYRFQAVRSGLPIPWPTLILRRRTPGVFCFWARPLQLLLAWLSRGLRQPQSLVAHSSASTSIQYFFVPNVFTLDGRGIEHRGHRANDRRSRPAHLGSGRAAARALA